jgi:hypothetical protein
VTGAPTPLVLHGTIFPHWLLAERVIAAIQTGDARYVLQTYLGDHKTSSFDQARDALCAFIGAPWNTGVAAHSSGSALHQLRELQRGLQTAC